MLLFYTLFMITLSIWDISSYEFTLKNSFFFLITMFLLIDLGIVTKVIWKDTRRWVHVLVLCSLSLLGIGSVIENQMNNSRQWFFDTIIVIAAFVLPYLVISYTKLYRIKLIQYLCIVTVPLLLIIARYTSLGSKVSGSYTMIGSFIISGLVVTGYMFIAAYFLSKPEKKYFGNTVLTLPMSIVFFLIYTVCLFFISGFLNNEFGIVLILGILSTLLFFQRCRQLSTKILYTGLCAGAAIFVMKFVNHVAVRVTVFLNPEKVITMSQNRTGNNIVVAADTVMYIYRNLRKTGFYGLGIGCIRNLKTIYTTIQSDHAFVAVLLGFGVFMAVLVLIIYLVIFILLFKQVPFTSTYDYYLYVSSGMVFVITTILSISGQLGSFITCGIPAPFISNGKSMNTLFAIILAIHIGLYNKYTRREQK